MKYKKFNKVPLYLQIVNELKKMIYEEVLKSNEKLPTEYDLCQQYNVSRTTLRQALSILEKESFITKIQGNGNFISHKKINQDRNISTSFYDDIKKEGKIPTSKIIKFSIEIADEIIAEKMDLVEGTKLYKLEWIRYADKKPLIYEIIRFPFEKFLGLEKFNLETQKLYEILEKKYFIKIDYLKEIFQPIFLYEKEAKYLNTKEGSLGMRIERKTFQNLKIIEYTESVVKGDAFTYSIKQKIGD